MNKIVICITDGYHEPTYYFDDGLDIYTQEEMLRILCQPHQTNFVMLTIHFDDIDEDDDDYIFLNSFEYMSKKERIENFNRLLELYRRTCI